MRHIFLSFLAMMILSACQSSETASSSSTIEGMVVDVWASSNCVQPGETVTVRATVTNKSAQTRVIELTNNLVLDLVVQANGETRRWSDGKPLTAELTRLELKPGASKSIEMVWHVDCCDALHVTADFAYNDRLGVSPSTVVMVSVCAGLLGP